MPEKTATKQLILEAVITCIEKYGVDKVTTRRIAEEAGTNIASINYHFRSKDELIEQTLTMTITHMMEDVFAAIDDAGKSFEHALTDVLFYLLDGSRTFPGISRAHMYRAVVQGDRDSMSSQAMIRVYDRLSQRAVRELPQANPKKVRLAVSQVMSGIMFALLTNDFFPLPREFQLTSEKNARLLAKAYVCQFRAMIANC